MADAPDQPRSDAPPLSRYDGWNSFATGLGTDADRRTTSTFLGSRLAYEQLVEMYRGEFLAARIVERFPAEMMRRGFRVAVKDNKDAAEAVTNRLDELDASEHIEQALYFARAFGGAGVLMGVDDGATDLRLPLNFDRIRSLDWLTVLDCRELQPAEYYTDPAHPRYGQPSVYVIAPQVTTDTNALLRNVHETRVLRFEGVRVTRRLLHQNNGWGDSVLQRVHEVLRDFGVAWGGAAHLLTEFSQGVLSIPGLLEMVATKKGQADLQTRLQAFQLMRSTVRAAVVDGGDGNGGPKEDFERKSTPIAGLADILDRFSTLVAVAADTPVSILFGQAPAGLNATGDSEIRAFYDRVAAGQMKQLRPQLNRLVKVLLRAKNGPTKGLEPATWKVAFPPLWEMTELEKADLRLKTSQADSSDITAGILDPAEVAISRYGGEEYSTETHLDTDARKAMAPGADPAPAPPPPPPTRADAALAEDLEREAFHVDAAPTGVAVVLRVPDAISAALALPGHEAPNDLHLTVGFIGRLGELLPGTIDRVRGALRAFAKVSPPVIGVVSGLGRFSIPDGLDAVHLSFDAPGLSSWREALLGTLARAGVSVPMRHGFDPHITVAYVPADATVAIGHQPATPIIFGTVELWAGSARESFALGGAAP
jgi:phage-related protein (TIGR01555 family)